MKFPKKGKQGNHTRHAGDKLREKRGESVSFLNKTGSYRTKKQTTKK